MTYLINEKPEPGIPALLGGALLFLAGGIWFLFKVISLMILQLNGTEVLGVIDFYYPGKFGATISFTYILGGEEVHCSQNAIITNSYKAGDQAVILVMPDRASAFIKSMLLPNVFVNFIGVVAIWASGVIFVRKTRIVQKIKEKN